MKKVTDKVKSERGVTLVALIAMIIIIFSILSVVLYNGRISVRLERLNSIYEDISSIEEKVQLYYLTNYKVPTKGEAFDFEAEDLNPNDTENNYYMINAGVLDDINLNNDISEYIINADTLTVYYKEGYEYEETNIHTIPREYALVEKAGSELSDKYSIQFENIIKISNYQTYEGEYNGDVITYGSDGDKYELPTLSKVYVNRRTYYFKGWRGNDNKYYTSAYKGTPSKVYAQWTNRIEKIRVTFYNGNTTYTYRDYILGEPYGEFPDPPGSRREFLGWKNENGDMIKEDSIVTANNTKLYAVWGESTGETDSITITFNPLEGTVKTKTKEVEYGKKYGPLPEAVPDDRNYEFEGWYLDKEFKNKITSESIVEVSRDTTLYAHYVKVSKKDFIVTFDHNRPDGYDKKETREYNNGERYGKLPEIESEIEVIEYILFIPHRVTYKFVGWNTRSDGFGKTITENTVVDLDRNTTIYAIWEKKGGFWD